MNNKNNKKLTPFAQDLRKNMTPEEKELWYKFLKKLPVTVNRQKVIGHYVVDFYCASANLAIELDGSQHFTYDALQYDKFRDEYLSSLGITVLRFTNHQIKTNFRGVCQDILDHIHIDENI